VTSMQDFVQQGYYCQPYPLRTMAFVRRNRLDDSGSEQALAHVISSAEYLLLFPYWYRVNHTGSFESLGKSTIASIKPIATSNGTAIRFPIIEYMLRLDLETVLGTELDQDLVLVEVTLNSIYGLTEDVDKSEAMLHPGNYVQLMNFLYRVDRAGRLQLVGENAAITIDDFFTVCQRLTSIIHRCSETLNHITIEMRAASQRYALSLDSETSGLLESMDVQREEEMHQN
jgi:flagellar hook-associated protein FlgK